MLKDPKKMIDEIEEEHKNYLSRYGDNNIDDGILYFSYILKEFYNYSSMYFESKYDNEKKYKLDYKDTLRCYLSTFNTPYIYLYNNKVCKENWKVSILDDLVYNVRKKIGKDKDGNLINTEQKCGIASNYFNKLAKNSNIKADILTTSGTFELFDYDMHNRSHAFNLVLIDGKKYIVDCTFSQFTKLFYMSSYVIKLPMFINAEPAYFLNQTKQGKKLLEEILKYGYFEVNKENLKLYLDSFVLSERNAFYYFNGGNMYDTEIDSSYYFDILNNIGNMRSNSDVRSFHYSSEKNEMPSIYGTADEIGSTQILLTKDQLHKLDKIIKK